MKDRSLRDKRSKKSDPVSRFQSMQHAWNADKFLKEKDHRKIQSKYIGKTVGALERERSIQRAPATPSNYIVPTDKRRDDIRNEIRLMMMSPPKF
jgi:hypothetical protein